MSKITTPRDLLVEELKDLHSAESQLLKALPKMAKAACSENLRAAFLTHLEQTRVHVERLDKIGAQLKESLTGKKCKAMAGLVAEGEEIIDEDAVPAMLDLALIGAAQKVEHYEIAGYGTTRTLAELAGESTIAEQLQTTLDEEGDTDQLLTTIASEMDLFTPADDDDAPIADPAVAKTTQVASSKTKPKTPELGSGDSQGAILEAGKKRARA